MSNETIYLLIPLSCLAGSLLAGLLGWKFGRVFAHTVAILGVTIAAVLSVKVLAGVMLHGEGFNGTVYTWGVSGGIPLEVGFLIDPLSAIMMVVVTSVS
ncbi:MAG: NADH-quinone oxidoreductase subunit L, partial [Pseudomonadota bacterium]